jgi:hypothetical protein
MLRAVPRRCATTTAMQQIDDDAERRRAQEELVHDEHRCRPIHGPGGEECGSERWCTNEELRDVMRVGANPCMDLVVLVS